MSLVSVIRLFNYSINRNCLEARSADGFIAVRDSARNKSQTHGTPRSGAAMPLSTSKRSHVYRVYVSPQCATPMGSNTNNPQ